MKHEAMGSTLGWLARQRERPDRAPAIPYPEETRESKTLVESVRSAAQDHERQLRARAAAKDPDAIAALVRRPRMTPAQHEFLDDLIESEAERGLLEAPASERPPQAMASTIDWINEELARRERRV